MPALRWENGDGLGHDEIAVAKRIEEARVLAFGVDDEIGSQTLLRAGSGQVQLRESRKIDGLEQKVVLVRLKDERVQRLKILGTDFAVEVAHAESCRARAFPAAPI